MNCQYIIKSIITFVPVLIESTITIGISFIYSGLLGSVLSILVIKLVIKHRMTALVSKKEKEIAFDILIFRLVFSNSACVSASSVPFIK